MAPSPVIGWTYCSGIGAPEAAAPEVDWRLASEIEKFPRAVLAHRYGYKLPEDHCQGDPLLWGDFTEITPDLARTRGLPLPNLLVAGTPCQSFSVAGLRGGIGDDRGNLTLKFVENLHAIVDARPDGRLAVLWENVPGVLSDKGNAFGCFLGGLVGAVDALPPPGDGSWPGEGMVQGPRARAAWAVLDAQWFGVAQRRRRVFVVVDFGGACDPAAVLLEPDRLRGDSPPRREAGQTAPTLPSRSSAGGGLGTDFDCDGGLIAAPIASCLNAAFGSKLGLEDQHINAGAPLFVAHALRGEGFDASEDGTGCGTPIVPVTFGAQNSATQGDDVCFDHTAALTTTRTPAVSFMENQRGEVRLSDTAAAITTAGGKPGQGYPAVAFDLRGRDGGAMMEGPHDTANLRAASGGSSRSYVAEPWAVRRLTPTECARLQGFPDDHCNIPWRGKDHAPDGPQYKALGNSMAVPVVRWILTRMIVSMHSCQSNQDNDRHGA